MQMVLQLVLRIVRRLRAGSINQYEYLLSSMKTNQYVVLGTIILFN